MTEVDRIKELRKQHREQGRKLKRAEALATGQRVGSGGQNEKTLEEHLRDGTYREDRHGPKPLAAADLTPKPKHLPPSRRKVAKRWIRNAADQWCADNGYWFDKRFAEHFRAFGRDNLKLWEGSQWEGKPFELLDWQYDKLFAPLMGWFHVHPDYGVPCRRFTESYCQVAKKNGKTPAAAYLGAYMMTVENESGGRVYSAASVLKQAKLVHRHAVRMIKKSPALFERCKIHGSTNTITYKPTEVTYEALASEAGTNEGLNGHCCLIDELHAWGAATGDRLYNELAWMFASRISPLLFIITTAGDDIQGVCGRQYEYSRGVASGAIHAPEHLSCIYEADKDDDPGDPETWAKANPSLDVTVYPSELAKAWEKAKLTPSTLAAFKRYRCNVWIDAANPWLPMDHWAACERTYGVENLRGEVCYGGLDLSKTRDTTALVLVFPWEDEWLQLAWFWLPEQTIIEQNHLVPYRQWVEAGHITAIPGAAIDYGVIKEKILWADETFDLRGIHYDPYRSASLMQGITADHSIPSTEFPQTILRFAEPMEEYERGVVTHTMLHDGNPVLTWQAGNVQCRIDCNNNKRPVKPPQQDVRKIDGPVAAVMAQALCMNDTDISQYESEDAELDSVEGFL